MIEDWLANAYGGLSRREFLARVGVAGIGLAGFAIAATPVAGQVITTSDAGLKIDTGKVASGDFQIPVYTAHPSAPGKYPVVIVIPEIFGMHEHIKDVTRRFARAGFFSITFEPYAREGGVLNLPDIDAVRKVVDPVPDARVMGDLDSITAWAGKHPAARADRLGVTGFCRGGMYTLLYAARNRDVKAAVAWYGQLRPVKTPGVRTVGPLDLAADINSPVLGLYGGEDLGIPVADVKAMEAALKAAGRTAEFVIYPGAPHAFFADYRPSYRPEAAKDAWGRCLAWFNRYLKT
ncbi:MAG TPA: dienelactone hydrolase family protein [Syntrophales bacterium]|nr:dienelactone hydrolase family protein [Syntrophales bacterium]HOX95276.1 dienelactone hydrolase family protein [Syntrophales bacterium]HPI57021.1 dienelactone hydrolase family protein [Syntrophales bacterium]HPN23849.1 dienelactone hydrolase family protein [Syntrophales bacterium]HQM30008.1 dienelactone hydrolase family protein [Syntrophales bacterium]